MAEHRARQRGSVRVADLIAQFDAPADDVRAASRHRPAADRPAFEAGTALATTAGPPSSPPPGFSMPSFSMPRLSMPPLPAMPSLGTARTRRTVIGAMSAGAFGVTAAISATGGFAPVVPSQSTGPEPAEFAVSPAAAAFALPVATAAPAPATRPVTGADLATAGLPTVRPVPTAAAAAPVTTPPPVVTLGRDDAAKAAADNDTTKNDTTKNDTTKNDTATKDAAGTSGADIAPATGSSAGLKALSFARANLGKPYRYGAVGPNAFDCSGLVMQAFKKAGVSLPRTSSAQSRVGRSVSRSQLQPGDLVFFYSPVSHVGIYLGGGKMLHASTSGEPVKISKIAGRPFHNARRV